MTKLSNQRVFDEALAHIRKQRKASIEPGTITRCRYREGDLMCAFGPAIKDYSLFLEGRSASWLMKLYKECLYDWAQGANSDVVDQIQSCHDCSAFENPDSSEGFMLSFETSMQAVAKQHELVYTPE